MTMDNPIKENDKKKWGGNGGVKGLFKNGTKFQNKNGNSLSNTNGNTCSDKENTYKDEMVECIENRMDCGLGPCSPSWLQSFASKQAFLVTFCLTWVLQGMFSTYFVSVITTIEKLFQLQSKTTGMIMSATEIGQISCTLLFTYYGGQGHRPRWIAWGMVLFAVCSFTCSLPHFLFGYQNVPTNEIISNNNSTSSSYAVCYNFNGSSPFDNVDGGGARCDETATTTAAAAALLASSSSSSAAAAAGQKQLPQPQSATKNIVLIIFLISLLGVGMGQTPLYALGISYIDDNVASRESPLYFAITIGVRILGPASGFIMGSICTRLFIDLSVDPPISPSDPRWLGAWWLGLVLDSALLLLASLAMFSFPQQLKTNRSTQPAAATAATIRSKQEAARRSGGGGVGGGGSGVGEKPRLKDFPKTIQRLLKNDILMFRTASSVLHILPIAGLYTFLPKFLESQFRFPAHTANMAAGVGGILVMGLGIIVSGVFILRMKPNARFVAAWIATAAALYAMGMGILMFVGCPMTDLVDLHYDADRVGTIRSDCAQLCHCDQKFSPVCGADKFTHFSACYAGCQNVTSVNGILEFSNCSCIRNQTNGYDAPSIANSKLTATMGYCDLGCNNFILYILLFSVFVFIHSTSEVGSMLLTLRCVDPRDKAMALGVIQFAIGLFGNVPCSVIYGAVVDSACLVWETVCGKTGACSLYDANSFRYYFHGTTSALMLCAFVVDLIVWYKACNINFSNDDSLPPIQEEELTPITEKSSFENSKN